MTVFGATYQTILNNLMLQSCQIFQNVHDLRDDPHTQNLVRGDGIVITCAMEGELY
jgi:hypothetical protein